MRQRRLQGRELAGVSADPHLVDLIAQPAGQIAHVAGPDAGALDHLLGRPPQVIGDPAFALLQGHGRLGGGFVYRLRDALQLLMLQRLADDRLVAGKIVDQRAVERDDRRRPAPTAPSSGA